MPAAREIGERADKVAPEAMQVRIAEPPVRREIEVGERRAPGVVGIDETSHVSLGSPDLVVDVLEVANVHVVIRELLEQHRRQPDDHPIVDARLAQVVEKDEERKIGPEHGLVDPLLAMRPPSGPAAIRQVRVQGENKGSHSRILWHGAVVAMLCRVRCLFARCRP